MLWFEQITWDKLRCCCIRLYKYPKKALSCSCAEPRGAPQKLCCHSNATIFLNYSFILILLTRVKKVCLTEKSFVCYLTILPTGQPRLNVYWGKWFDHNKNHWNSVLFQDVLQCSIFKPFNKEACQSTCNIVTLRTLAASHFDEYLQLSSAS